MLQSKYSALCTSSLVDTTIVTGDAVCSERRELCRGVLLHGHSLLLQQWYTSLWGQRPLLFCDRIAARSFILFVWCTWSHSIICLVRPCYPPVRPIPCFENEICCDRLGDATKTRCITQHGGSSVCVDPGYVCPIGHVPCLLPNSDLPACIDNSKYYCSNPGANNTAICPIGYIDPFGNPAPDACHYSCPSSFEDGIICQNYNKPMRGYYVGPEGGQSHWTRISETKWEERALTPTGQPIVYLYRIVGKVVIDGDMGTILLRDPGDFIEVFIPDWSASNWLRFRTINSDPPSDWVPFAQFVKLY